MSTIPRPEDDEIALYMILTDETGIELAEFAWTEEANVPTHGHNRYRVWPSQWAWYRCDDSHQIDACGRAVGKSQSIQMRCAVFPFVWPGLEMAVIAPDANKLDLLTGPIEGKLLGCRLTREMLKKRGNSDGINRSGRWEAFFENGARILTRIPHEDGSGVKGLHSVWIECVRGDVPVTLADGTARPIRELVEERYAGDVLTWDADQERLVTRRVTNWYTSPRAGRKFVEVNTSVGTTYVTTDHLVAVHTGAGLAWKQAGELDEQDVVLHHDATLRPDGNADLAGTVNPDWHATWRRLRDEEPRTQRQRPSLGRARGNAAAVPAMDAAGAGPLGEDRHLPTGSNVVRRFGVTDLHDQSPGIHGTMAPVPSGRLDLEAGDRRGVGAGGRPGVGGVVDGRRVSKRARKWDELGNKRVHSAGRGANLELVQLPGNHLDNADREAPGQGVVQGEDLEGVDAYSYRTGATAFSSGTAVQARAGAGCPDCGCDVCEPGTCLCRVQLDVRTAALSNDLLERMLPRTDQTVDGGAEPVYAGRERPRSAVHRVRGDVRAAMAPDNLLPGMLATEPQRYASGLVGSERSDRTPAPAMRDMRGDVHPDTEGLEGLFSGMFPHPGQQGAPSSETTTPRSSESSSDSDDLVYCLDIEDTHAFFAGGVLVHNCDEAQDAGDPCYVELEPALRKDIEGHRIRFHGVSNGLRDKFYDLSQPGSDYTVHKIMAMDRPSWCEEERRKSLSLYGNNPQDPDYRRNIYGDHGDRANAVFVVARLLRCLAANPKDTDLYNTDVYRHIEITGETWEEAEGDLNEVLLGKLPAAHLLGWAEHPRGYKSFHAGMDVGETDSPSEILVFGAWDDKDGIERMDHLLRVTMRRMAKDPQLLVIDALFRHYLGKLRSFGIDANGLGTGYYQDLARGPWGSLVYRCHASENVAVRKRTKEEMRPGETDPMEYRNMLEWATDRLRQDWVDLGRLRLSHDPEVINEWQGQTYSMMRRGTGGAASMYGKKNYSRGKCHTLDAAKHLIAAKLLPSILEEVHRPDAQDDVYEIFVGASAGSGGYGYDDGF